MVDALILGAVLFGIVVVGYLLLSAGSPSPEKETRKVDDTLDVTQYFEQVKATVEYPDGSEETITYDGRSTSNNVEVFYTYDEDCFRVKRDRRSTMGRPSLDASVPEENKRYINLDNVRSVDIERTDEYVAVAEVPVTKKQERYGEDDTWRNTYYNWNTLNSNEYDVDIWLGYEWEAHKEDK